MQAEHRCLLPQPIPQIGRSRCYSFQTLNPLPTDAWLSRQGFRLIDGQKNPKPVHFLPRRHHSDLDSHGSRREALWQKLGDQSPAATSWRLLSATDNTPGALSQCLPQKYLGFHGIFQRSLLSGVFVATREFIRSCMADDISIFSYGMCHSWLIDNDRVRSWKHGRMFSLLLHGNRTMRRPSRCFSVSTMDW